MKHIKSWTIFRLATKFEINTYTKLSLPIHTINQVMDIQKAIPIIQCLEASEAASG